MEDVDQVIASQAADVVILKPMLLARYLRAIELHGAL